MGNKDFYCIIEKATGFIWVISEDLEEIINIFQKNFKSKYFLLENNKGKKISL